MPHRLIIPALSGGSAPATKADAPAITAIRLVYGVGPVSDRDPSGSDFRPSYTVEIPLFSLGGLDPDGVYEFDAATLLRTIQARAQRRRWGVRLELTLEQSAAAVSAGDVVVAAPSADTGVLAIVGNPRGTTTPGGGRQLVVATPVISDPARVEDLGGRYEVAVGDDPPTRRVQLALNRFEFEG